MTKTQTADQLHDIGTLIEQLGPPNNRWRDGRPAEKVMALWEMGNVLQKHAPGASDALLWAVQDRSYLKRNLLRYALIVRRSWGQPDTLATLVQGLQSYTVFREALPFLKGDREGIDTATYDKVIASLSTPDTHAATRYLKALKARKIGRLHHKGASRMAVRGDASIFIPALAHLEEEALNAEALWLIAPHEELVALSQIAMAIATEDTIARIPLALEVKGEALPELSQPLIGAARGGRASISAFRRLVGQTRLMQAADLLNSLCGAETFVEWRRRHGAPLTAAQPAQSVQDRMEEYEARQA